MNYIDKLATELKQQAYLVENALHSLRYAEEHGQDFDMDTFEELKQALKQVEVATANIKREYAIF